MCSYVKGELSSQVGSWVRVSRGREVRLWVAAVYKLPEVGGGDLELRYWVS